MASVIVHDPPNSFIDTQRAGNSVRSWEEPGAGGRESAGAVGPHFRRGRQGPELALVEEFLTRFPYRAPAGCRVTIFLEPRLPSGFPDAVAVVWDPSAAAHWADQRAELQTGDLRLMQLVVDAGPTTSDHLTALTGRNRGRVFRAEGEEAYRAHQREHENEVLAPGVAFPLVRRLLDLNGADVDQQVVEIVLLSRNDPDTGFRVFNSIEHHGLAISRAAFVKGRNPHLYMSAFNASFFLSANVADFA